MSRFEEWAKASGRGGSLFGAFRRSRVAEADAAPLPGATADEGGLDRRQLFKRAGIIGMATVWATPVVQSVLAPVATAASPGCTPGPDPSGCGGTCAPCALGLACSQSTDCSSGNCTGGVCRVANGQACVGSTAAQKDVNCGSGYCNGTTCAAPPGNHGLDSACHGSTQAVANANCGGTTATYCSGWNTTSRSGTCKVPDGGTCIGSSGSARSASCASTKCSGTTCLKSAGASCTTNSECANSCSNGFCT